MNQDNNDSGDQFLNRLGLADYDDDPEDKIIDLVPATHTTNDVIEEDVVYVRDNLRGLIRDGRTYVKDISELAKAAQSVQAYEVVSTLMMTLLKANKDLADLSFKRKQAAEQRGSADQPAGSTTQNLFVGSTSELLAMMKESAKKKDGG